MAEVITQIALCNVPITPTHQILFDDSAAQLAYFSQHKVYDVNDAKYQPRSGEIRVKGYVESLQNANYGYYRNRYDGYTRVYYFWIVAKEFRAKEVTALTIQLDVIQTYMFHVKHNPCFVERMHVDDDTFGAHTYPEDFELGDYVCYHKKSVVQMEGELCYIVATSLGGFPAAYNGIYSGVQLVHFKPNAISELNNYIKGYADQGKADAIAYIFAFPETIIDLYYGGLGNMYDVPDTIVKGVDVYYQDTKASESIRDRDNVDGESVYKPKNKKVLCYPFKLIQIVAPDGNKVILKRELFKNSQMFYFTLSWTIGQNPTFSLTPKDYDGKNISYEDSIECNGYPLCSWNNDNYANWYAQHSNTIRAGFSNNRLTYNTNAVVAQNNYNTGRANAEQAANMGALNTVASSLGSLFSLQVGNAVSSAVMGGINTGAQYQQNMRNLNNDLSNANLLNDTNYQTAVATMTAAIQDAVVQPNTCKGDTTASGLDAMRGTNTFYVEFLNIRPEYAKIVDDYFSVFGYKVMELVPDPSECIKTRRNWNYIKTVNDSCFGDLPQADRDEIARIFNNGLTFWHNPTTFMDYTQANDIRR